MIANSMYGAFIGAGVLPVVMEIVLGIWWEHTPHPTTSDMFPAEFGFVILSIGQTVVNALLGAIGGACATMTITGIREKQYRRAAVASYIPAITMGLVFAWNWYCFPDIPITIHDLLGGAVIFGGAELWAVTLFLVGTVLLFARK